MKVIDDRRQIAGLPSVTASGRARHIATAAKLGLGTDKLDEIKIVGDAISEGHKTDVRGRPFLLR